MLVTEVFALTLYMLNMGFPRGQCLDRYCSNYILMIFQYLLKNCHNILFADDTTIYATGTDLLHIFTRIYTY